MVPVWFCVRVFGVLEIFIITKYCLHLTAKNTTHIMETSTLLFIASLLVAFVFLRWLITPLPDSLPQELNELRESTERTAAPRATNRVRRREVTGSMVEVVQAIAPQLTEGQIRFDLEKTGSVELTIENFMENGTLPFPPGESPQPPVRVDRVESRPSRENSEATSLIDKYNLKDKVVESDTPVSEDAVDGKWGSTKEERDDLLSKRREEMILRARNRLAAQLKNEVNIDGIAKN